MYKISINQNEKLKSDYKQEKNPLLKIISLLFIIMMIITTMVVLIIVSNNWNSTINTNNSSNWDPNQDKIWEEYYKNNCRSNKKYTLTDYEGNLKNITLNSTNKKLKNFYLSDLLKQIDRVLQTKNIDIPNNFFAHLPINPAIDIKINNEDALNNDFAIKIPSYKEKVKQFTITIYVSQLGNNYNLNTCNLSFNFNVENDVMPEKFNIFDLTNKITIPLQTISMMDATKGTKNEIALHVNQIIQEKFLKKVNREESLSDKVTKNDFDLNFNLVKNINNYTLPKKITVVINANNDSEIITGQLNISFNVKAIWAIKSLTSIKSVLANDESITKELITVVDDSNVSKTDIDNHITSLISKKINKVGQETWHQVFSDQDYIITNNATTGNYQETKMIIVTIIGKNQLQDAIELLISLKGNNTVKSLTNIKSVLANDESITKELITVVDDSNVSKTDIDNHITSLISKKINKVGQETWHQVFSDQDYIITNNATTGNYQETKMIIVTIIGKNQLQDTIELQISIRCHNQSANDKVFKSDNFNVNNLNSIALYPNVLSTGIIYPITFKNDYNSLTSLLFATAIKDLNKFPLVDDVSLEMNIEIKLDGDNYQINCHQAIEPNVIKKINDIVLVSDSEQNGEYQHLKNIGIIIKYNDNQEYKIIKKMDVNIKNNSLTFINFSSLVKITSWR